MIKIVIVEDQNMLRDSLTFTINSQNNMRVVASLSDAADALEAVKRTNADLVLMDVCTENDSSGIVAAAKIKQTMNNVRIIIMTGMPEITFIEQARAAHVDSFVYKNVSTQKSSSTLFAQPWTATPRTLTLKTTYSRMLPRFLKPK